MKEDSDDPIEPHGWFRWLHDQSSWRCQGRRFLPEDSAADRLDSLTASAIGRHSWETGYLGRLDLLEKNWGSLTPRQRGLALGGASEKESNWAWILARLPECKPGAVETCEIACNALSAGNQRALAAVLEASGDLVGHVPRYNSMNWKAGRFSKTLSQLSCRCIDLVLEAAQLRNNPAGVRLALKLGASPDIPIWLLERSFSEKHCALSFCIKKRFRSCMSALLAAGANPVGIPFCTPDLPLFEAISTRQDALAIRLLKMGAALRGAGDHQKKAPHLPPAADDFFGHFDDDLEWANEVIGPLIPFVRVEEKSCFYNGNGQGGYWQTFLDAIGGDVRRLKRFERHGLDCRLSAEEFLTIFKAGHYEKLLYLMSRQPATTRAKVLFRIRRRNISFGEQGPLALRPQDDRINEATGFEPANQAPCQLPDGSTIHADLSAIAPTDHRLGPCLPGHFWLRTESSVRCRRGKETVMRKIAHTWKMTAFPQNTYQLMKVLPAVRLVEGRFIRLGVTVGALSWLAGEKRLQAAINSWTESEGMKSIAAAAFRLIRAQDQTNRRLPEPVLSEEELDGYPREFWPHLIRIDSGTIGMTEKSSFGDPDLLKRYRAWEKANKKEDTFVPDPRILDYDIWHQVCPEFRPFLIWDDLVNRPGFRQPDGSEYERAMCRKAGKWWNAMMTAKIKDSLASSSSATNPSATG